MLAEYDYWLVRTGRDAGEVIAAARQAGNVFPFDRQFRIVSAKWLGAYALQAKDPQWSRIAIAEMRHALWYDPTQADLLMESIVLELSLHQVDAAKVDFARFKRVARTSPMIPLLEHDLQVLE
jgi:hypothetical protein